MTVKKRIEKIEKLAKLENPMSGARDLVMLCIETGMFGDIDIEKIDIKKAAEELAAKFAATGFTLGKVLDDIAREGPPLPKGDINWAEIEAEG